LVAVTNALGVPVIWQVSENAVTLNPAEDPVVTIVIEGAKVTLSWGSVSGVDKYNIYYATETFANIEVENYASVAVMM
jgi:hypothetical protein